MVKVLTASVLEDFQAEFCTLALRPAVGKTACLYGHDSNGSSSFSHQTGLEIGVSRYPSLPLLDCHRLSYSQPTLNPIT